MSAAGYPPDRIEAVLRKASLPDCYRIMPVGFLASPLGTVPSDSRFCSRDAGYAVLYATPDFATAFVETVVRDRFARSRLRDVALKEITGRGWARISGRRGAVLTLLDLRADGCTRIGAPTDVIHARNHAAGRAFATSIHGGYADVDGLLHVSRLTGADVYAIFDRAVGKLDCQAAGLLADHPDLPDVLARHDIRLSS